MAHDKHVIIKPARFRFSDMAYEEIEGRYLERFGELPNAEAAMTFYAIETRQCPICEEKHLDYGGIVPHMLTHFLPDTEEQIWQTLTQMNG